MRTVTRSLMITGLLLLLLPLAALGAPAGKITHVEGRADVTAGGKTVPAQLDGPVDNGDILRTKSGARAEVTFRDGNILRLAENTRIRITEYEPAEGKGSRLDLFRGKVQNIVSGLARNARYEVHTPTSVCGVRGTDFFAFYLDGISGFIPREGTLYTFSLSMPQVERIVAVGQAVLVRAADQPPAVRPIRAGEVDTHLRDTAPGEGTKRDAQPGGVSGPAAGGAASLALLIGQQLPASWESFEDALRAGGSDVESLYAFAGGLFSNGAALGLTVKRTLEEMGYFSVAGSPFHGLSSREYPLPGGGTAGEYLNYTVSAPLQGISEIKASGAQAMWGEWTAIGPTSYTVVAGGYVKGLFDPATTPLTWADIPQGQGTFLETRTFVTQQALLSDADRRNFEQTNKIPAFDVGTASLSGHNGSLWVDMGSVKFFRFQNESNPAIWATGDVTGSYTAIPAAGTKVTLTSSNGLTGLSHTFEVKQWDVPNRIWGAAIYLGAGDTGGTLSRSAADTARESAGNLPAGASSTIAITELRGGAAGSLTPNPLLPGRGAFTGTASGTVR
jgi:hypothetical protein